MARAVAMKRIDVIRTIVAYAEMDDLIISNLGFPSRELYAVADRPGNFYMLGSMGLASSIGLGCAMGTKRKVYVLDGDGSVLMNAGSLATIAQYASNNLCLVIIDNKVYGSTGNQPTHTAGNTDLVALARAAGNRNVTRVRHAAGLRAALQRFDGKQSIIVVDTEPGNASVGIIPIRPEDIAQRFMRFLRNTAT
ncbi:MAG: sulfopyruvate decarboxylase subunit beta [Desulfobacterota bacterium]|nr:sulfopyruvate decarboxylase subunit beta [Thermodesulfobacteriota bacterium]